MNSITNHKLPAIFWVVAITALVWNLLGIMAYVMEVTMNEEALAALPAAQQALYAVQPTWVTGAFATAVFAGLGGSVALALRRSLATAIFGVSLVAVIAQMFYVFAISDTLAVMGAGSAVLPLLIFAIAVFLVWFSARAHRKGWI